MMSHTSEFTVRADPARAVTRTARAVIDAVAAAPRPSVYISGNAGSGKSSVLAYARRVIDRNDRASVVLDSTTDIQDVPLDVTLLVDDAHLLAKEQLRALRDRASRSASTIVTSRPESRNADLVAVAGVIERSSPAIVLGHVTRSDVLELVSDGGRAISPACIEHVLRITGGVTWLVCAALAAHDERDCSDDPEHHALAGHLMAVITHRLGTMTPAVRAAVETVGLTRSIELSLTADHLGADVVEQAYADGLLLRTGRPVPIVRRAVHASVSTSRLVDLITGEPDIVDPLMQSADDWLTHVHDPRLVDALVSRAHHLAGEHPAQARDLYEAAVRAGADSSALRIDRAVAAWGCGALDEAAALVDRLGPSDGDSRAAIVAASVWSARGMLEMGVGYYAGTATHESATEAAIVRIGSGRWQAADAANPPQPSERSTPTTLGVAMSLLRSGLIASLDSGQAHAALADLVRASQLYTSARGNAPIPEHPAVIAAVVALNLGDLSTARSVIEQAIDGHHGNAWMRSRLLLWRSWIAIQRARPQDAREALDAALEGTPRPAPRDSLLVHAIRIALARRYEDAAGLAAAWEQGRDGLLSADVDLFMLLPFTEYVTAAARLGDAKTTDGRLERALELVRRLGSPSLWSSHVHWAGIQAGILTNRPHSLNPHARALVEASDDDPLAATMARAGKIWTSVLAGTVDVDEVESAASELAAVGLIWDAARLAGHGAARSDDRKISARLLSRARELHPRDAQRTSADTVDETTQTDRAESVLSDRETDVARLVLEGKTYAEIGQTIFISPRTAEHHIASIRRRLGATSRSDLLAKLRVVLATSAAADPRNVGERP